MHDPSSFYEACWRRGGWGTAPRSGIYASPPYTNRLRAELPGLLERHKIQSVFDAPCGDYTWMSAVALPDGCQYFGADIVAPLIAELRNKYNSANAFRVFNLLTDPFPEVDLWLCRDCLYLYSIRDMAKIFDNFLRSNIRFALLTSHRNLENGLSFWDGMNETPTNLEMPPFSFGACLEYINDWYDDPKRSDLHPRTLRLWDMQKSGSLIRAFVERAGQ
jgi:hypothetical protein